MQIRAFEPVEGVASAQGIDVSNFQGRYDWAGAVRTLPSLAFGIHRLTQGLGAPGTNSPDPTAAYNHQAIAGEGLRRGCYHFLDPFADGAAQARYCVDTADSLGPIGQRDMFALDNETRGASPATTAFCADSFMNELSALLPHNPPLVYSNLSFGWGGYDAGLGRWPSWLAYPSPSAPVPPSPWTVWKFWQWGLRNGVDADAFNGTIADLDTWLGSFAPAQGLVMEKTDGTATIGQLAAGRSMKPLSFLSAQVNYHPDDGENLAGSAVPPAGMTWWHRP